MAFAIRSYVQKLVRRPFPLICAPRRQAPPRAAMPSSAPFTLDKPRFAEQWQLFAVRVPAKLCNGTRKALKPHVFRMPRVQSVLRPNPAEHPPDAGLPPAMVVLLRYFAERPVSAFRAPPRGNCDEAFVGLSARDVAAGLNATEVSAKTAADVAAFVKGVGEGDIVTRTVQISYQHWTMDQVLRNLLPEGVTVPSSFETIGHIAHVNLLREHEQHKMVIGAVMLDKLQPRIKTIVNKVQSTGGQYRTFDMEVLAGDKNLETTLKENGCTFRLDFSKVYWNSRLETEHRRIIQSLKPDDILADAFCGIGPFALPAAHQNKCRKIFANDLNPSSIHYLQQSAKMNHVDEDKFISSCSCARQFLRRIVRDEKVPITRVVMNFPSGGPEFLDVFRGLYNEMKDENFPMPLVHCYCFVKGIEDMDSARRRARLALFGESVDYLKTKEIMPDSEIEVRDIRDVAPFKRQVCLTFRVPMAVACSDSTLLAHLQPPLKKVKMIA